MTPYTPSLWSQAPEGASHWIGFKDGTSTFWVGSILPPEFDNETIVHERPAAYKSPEQLIAEYRKQHGAEIEADVKEFLDIPVVDPGLESKFTLDGALEDALFHLILIEKHLAAERARIEGEGK